MSDTTIELRLDAYSLAQLKLIRRAWRKVTPANQSLLLRSARSLAGERRNGPKQAFALPSDCSPAAIARLRELADLWPALCDQHRTDILSAAIRSSELSNV